MMKKKNRKSNIKNPILRNCMYIIVPVVALVAFKFIGTGATWLFDLVSKAGWSVLATFVITSLGWNVFYGWKELRNSENGNEDDEETDEDEGDVDEDVEWF